MLELVDLKQRISKAVFQEVFPNLEIELGKCQRAAGAARVPIIIVFEGWEAAGKGTIINRLTQVLDPRGFKVHAIAEPSEAERFRPWMWRFWNDLPDNRSIAIFDCSWYERVLGERVCGQARKRQWQQAYEDIEEFERTLADSGAVILKFWLHISKKEQRRRFAQLRNNRATAWKVGSRERQQHRAYEKWLVAVEEMLERTGAAYAPWTIVEATDARYSLVKVFETVVKTIQHELERRAATPAVEAKPMPEPPDTPLGRQTILDRLDLSLTLQRDDYEKQLAGLQKRLWDLEHELYMARIPAIIVYEGSDAGGKGGNLKRLTRGLDPRGYEVVPVAAPTDVEKAHHYLWRFWLGVPKAGHITIFDRSWYGRVLVERVEGFCTEPEWRRAYREINEFERQLCDFGTVVVKFWLHIDREEQLRRFQARQQDPAKQWKITDEDWRNREKWKQYDSAVVDMLEQTSTTYAPWTILEGNCKLYARIKALRTVADALENALKKRA